jgi:hypothetical protein
MYLSHVVTFNKNEEVEMYFFEQFLMEESDLWCQDKTVALLSRIMFKNNDTYVE